MNNKKYIALVAAVLVIVMSFSIVAYGGDHDTPVIPIPQGDSSSEQTPSDKEFLRIYRANQAQKKKRLPQKPKRQRRRKRKLTRSP